MGCWNGTCGVSQIHIRAGEEVVVFPLASVPASDLCYTTGFWSPFALPFYGQYDDYGNAEETHGIGLKYLLTELHRVRLGDEEAEADVDVVGSEEAFWNGTHRRTLFIKGGSYHPKAQIDKMMVKKSILDHLMENFQMESYDWDNKTYESTYYYYTYHDLVKGIPAIADALLDVDSLFPNFNVLPEPDRTAMKRMMMRHDYLGGICRALNKDDDLKQSDPLYNRAASWLSHQPSHLRYGGFAFNIDDVVSELVENADRDSLIAVLTDYMTMMFVDQLFMTTRKLWTPQGGAGSQSDEESGYRALAAAVTSVLDAEARERDEMDE